MGLYLSNSGMEQEGQEPCLLWLLTLGLVSTDLPLKAPGREGETNITGFFFISQLPCLLSPCALDLYATQESCHSLLALLYSSALKSYPIALMSLVSITNS